MGEDRGGGESVCVHVADVRTPTLTPQPPSLTLPPQAGEENVERTAYAVRMLKLEGEGILMFTAFTFRRNVLRLIDIMVQGRERHRRIAPRQRGYSLLFR